MVIEKWPQRFQEAKSETALIYQKGDKTKQELLEIALKDKRKFEKVKAGFALLKEALPENLFDKLVGLHLERGVMPFNMDRFDFEERSVGSGGHNLVFKLASKEDGIPSLVMKISRKIGSGAGTEELLALAKEYRESYLKMKERYANIPDLIPDEQQVIIQHDRSGKPALVTLQKFFGDFGELVDVIKLSDEELRAYLTNYPKLRERFTAFVDISTRIAEEEGVIPDLNGPSNLVIVPKDNERSAFDLVYLDSNSVGSATSKNDPGAVDNQGKMKRLQKIRSEFPNDTFDTQ